MEGAPLMNAHRAAPAAAAGGIIQEVNMAEPRPPEEEEHGLQPRRQAQVVANLALVDNDGGNNNNDNNPEQRALNPDQEGRMDLPEEEHQWALQIKDTLENIPELAGTVSDYWCAQMAIQDIRREDVDLAVEKAEQLQAFRETYGIVDTWEFGCRCIAEYQKLCPNHMLEITFLPQQGCYVLVTDKSKVDVKAIRQCPDGMGIWFRALYFVCQAFCCDLEAVRKGAIALHECGGHGTGSGMDFKTYKQTYTNLLSFYPFQLNYAKFFHTGVLMNLVVSMVRPFLPKERRNKLITGCVHQQTLDVIFNQPTPEAAEARVLRRCAEMLQRRYRHEANFSL